jgi:hypothetical protein
MDNIKLRNLDDYLIEYFFEWKNYHWTNISFFEYLVKIIHFMLIIFLLIGPSMPHKILPFYIISLLSILISWKIFGGCILTLPFNKQSLIPVSKKRSDKLVLILLIVAGFSYIYPQYSPFNILHTIVNHMNEYYN